MPADFDRSPVDLTRQPDFWLGPIHVRPATLEVLRGESREGLEPRVMQVLVALAQASPDVVSRDDLIMRCWEGRVVGDDAINRTIGRLRRLSEADSGASFSIETIPRVGYRLQPTQTQPATSPPLPPIPSPPQGERARVRGLRQPWIIAAVVLLLLTAATATWLFWPAPHWTVDSSRPFISTLALEGDPAFSPNGLMLAYVAGPDVLSRRVYVRNLAGGDPVRLGDDDFNDSSPSFASDNTRIAYVGRRYNEPCRILVTETSAGHAREAGRCAADEGTALCWRPGTELVYFADRNAQGAEALFSLNLASGDRRQLPGRRQDYPPQSLRCSPDGKSLLYLTQEAFAVMAIHIVDLDSGQDRRAGRIDGYGFADWSEDSRSVLATVASGNGSDLIAYPLNGSPGYKFYATTQNVAHLAIGAGGQMALETQTYHDNLARAVQSPTAPPDVIDVAGGRTWSPSYAPDGTLVFLSNRSGENALWIQKPGAAPLLIAREGLAHLSRVRFSPDGSKLVMVVQQPDRVLFHILNRDGAALASFENQSVGYALPSWSPDGKSLFVSDHDLHRTIRIDIADPSKRVPVTPPNWGAYTMHGDAILASRGNRPGIWRIDGTPRLLNDKFPAQYNPALAFRGDDLVFPLFGKGIPLKILGQPLAGGPDHLLGYAPAAESYSDFVVEPKTGDIIYVAAVGRDTNIDLLRLSSHR